MGVKPEAMALGAPTSDDIEAILVVGQCFLAAILIDIAECQAEEAAFLKQ